MEPLSKLTLKHVFERSVERFGPRPALSFVNGEPLTFAEFGSRTRALSHFLRARGIRPGDRVALLSESMPHWAVAYFSITTMGSVAVPMLPDFHPKEVHNILDHSEAKALLISRRQLGKVEGYSSDVLQTAVLIDDFTQMPLATTRDEAREERRCVLASPPAEQKSGALPVEEEDLAAIIYTSGTTGQPKGVMLTHRNIVFNADKGADRVTINEEDRVLSMLPLAHTFECNLGLLVPIMYGACVYYLEKPPSASVLLPAMAKVKPTMMVSVPLVIEKIHRLRIVPHLTRNALLGTLCGFSPTRRILHRLAGRKLLSLFGGKLHFFGIGGAALAPDTELFLREAKFPYTVGYGLTETSPLVTGTNPEEMRFRTSGFPLPGVDVKIDNPNPETGEGEILVRGPNVMKGYFKNPEETAKVLSQDGWLRTGDLGLFREDGYLLIKGRLKNVIIGPSGENIYPEEIESVINELTFVEESLVFEREGRLVARVHFNYDVLRLHLNCVQIGAAEMQKCVAKFLRDLRDLVNRRLNAFSRISEIIEQMEPFEKTPTHKIKRHRHVGAE